MQLFILHLCTLRFSCSWELQQMYICHIQRSRLIFGPCQTILLCLIIIVQYMCDPTCTVGERSEVQKASQPDSSFNSEPILAPNLDGLAEWHSVNHFSFAATFLSLHTFWYIFLSLALAMKYLLM